MENPPQFKKQQEEGVGPLVGIIIVITLLVLGGVYFLVTKDFAKQPAPQTETSTTTVSQ